uniref:Uncharacterized protein n=1 Tax=Vespula pensylvanica TaxID=30213 RepID=A0A834KR15_VESPE|nr:hypothetical protein H0235_013572 [Vespula pensylvanica]
MPLQLIDLLSTRRDASKYHRAIPLILEENVTSSKQLTFHTGFALVKGSRYANHLKITFDPVQSLQRQLIVPSKKNSVYFCYFGEYRIHNFDAALYAVTARRANYSNENLLR